MSDLIERLHNADPHEHGDNFQLVCEAADEIDRLQSLLEAANEMEADREAALQEIDRLQEYNLKLMDTNVRLSDKVIRLRSALERIERHCDADSSRIVHEIQVMAREALRDDRKGQPTNG